LFFLISASVLFLRLRQIHNGQEWDYVFDVDVADGMPPLKLALNRGDNPYKVRAHRLSLDVYVPNYFSYAALGRGCFGTKSRG
jgi:hypothetical protein